MDLPIYRLVIDEEGETGVEFIALVEHPAIEINWRAFNKNEKHSFTSDPDRRIISGPLMVADVPIYRKDSRGEYNVVFEASTIEKITLKYFKNHLTSNVNIMHDPTKKVEGVFMFESFIIDPSRGITPPIGFETLTPGSWFGSFKVENDQVWEDFIKTGEFKGFSVEGLFIEEITEPTDEQALEAILESIK